MWNRDEVRGRAERVKGRVKEDAAHEGFGRGCRKVGNAIKDIGREIGR